MSLINDALKQARKTPPANPPNLSSLPPAAAADPLLPAWLLPGLVVVLIVAAIFFIGWAVAHRSVGAVITAPQAAGVTPAVASTAVPAATPRPTTAPAPVKPPVNPPVNPPGGPKLQGIFYSPRAPSAIVDGRLVHLGDPVWQYHVKTISRHTITLIGPDKKEIMLGMDN